ncbi:MAG: NAD(P)/FAD-dependent oxidoreductase [Thermomicrobiales bacterium]
MHVLILGAGFGGLELATCLSDALGDEVAVTLIDQNDSFIFGFSKLDVMFGREEPAAVRMPYRAFAKPGVKFRQETILSIDPARKRAVTDRGSYEGDVLVVALGADLDPSATPGLVEFGHEFYSVKGAEELRDVLAGFAGGKVVIAVTTPHYKCPPAPSECSMLMHDFLVERGLRETSTITLVSPQPTPLPVSPEVGAAVLAALVDRDITFMGSAKITAIEDEGRTVRLADGRAVEADLVLAIPLHVAPKVVIDSCLTENGWIPTDKYTLKTRFPDVYAFGDVASVGVPRAGVFSEGQAKIVAQQLIAQAHAAADETRYEGAGICYLEFGRGQVGKVDVNFLGGPSTRAALEPPSRELRAEKTAFGSSRKARWFGLES